MSLKSRGKPAQGRGQCPWPLRAAASLAWVCPAGFNFLLSGSEWKWPLRKRRATHTAHLSPRAARASAAHPPPPPPRCTGPPSAWQERECALGAGSRERAPVKNGLGEGFCSCLIPSLEGKFPPPRPHPMCAICVTLNGMQIWSLPIRPLEASQLQPTLANIQTAIVWDSLPLS